ncbi:hypothetical protein FRC11_008190, partial [Ceratobasidium sp. 423]
MPRSSKKPGSARKRNKRHAPTSQPAPPTPGMDVIRSTTHTSRTDGGRGDGFGNGESMNLPDEREGRGAIEQLELEYHYRNE